MQTNRGEGQVLLIPGREFVMREHAPRVASEIWTRLHQSVQLRPSIDQSIVPFRGLER